MRPNPLADGELRIGEVRVYYQVRDDPDPVVQRRALGVKRGNRVYIADVEADQ
jgi:hypothetical protein